MHLHPPFIFFIYLLFVILSRLISLSIYFFLPIHFSPTQHEGISMHQLEERGRPTVSVQNPPEAFQGHWVRMLYIRYTELDLFHSGTTEWQWPLEQRVV